MIKFYNGFGYWNENMNQNFRFNNPKQFSNWIILVSFCSSYLTLCITTKTCTQIQNFKRNSLENYNDSEHNLYCDQNPHIFEVSDKIAVTFNKMAGRQVTSRHLTSDIWQEFFYWGVTFDKYKIQQKSEGRGFDPGGRNQKYHHSRFYHTSYKKSLIRCTCQMLPKQKKSCQMSACHLSASQ